MPETTHSIPDYIQTITSSVVSSTEDQTLYTVPSDCSLIILKKEFYSPCVTVNGSGDYSSISGTYVGEAIYNGKIAYHRSGGSSKWLLWVKDGQSDYYWAFNDSCSDIMTAVQASFEVYSEEDTTYPFEATTWKIDSNNVSVTVEKENLSLEGRAVFKEGLENETARPFSLLECGESDNVKEMYEAGTVIKVNANVGAFVSVTGIEYDVNGMPKVPEKPITSIYVSGQWGMVSEGVYTLGDNGHYISSEWEGYGLYYNGSNTWRIDSMMGYATIQISNAEGDIHEVLGTKSWTMHEGAIEPYEIEITITVSGS